MEFSKPGAVTLSQWVNQRGQGAGETKASGSKSSTAAPILMSLSQTNAPLDPNGQACPLSARGLHFLYVRTDPHMSTHADHTMRFTRERRCTAVLISLQSISVSQDSHGINLQRWHGREERERERESTLGSASCLLPQCDS